MVYIDRYGRVCERRPWDLGRIAELFTGLWFIVTEFFRTLIAPFTSENRGGDNSRAGWHSGHGGGGGGGGGGGRGGGPGGNTGSGLRPNRRIGRITNSMDCNIPGGG